MKAQLKEAAEAKKPVKAAGVFRCLLGGLRNPKEPLRQGAALKAMLSLCHSHHLMSRMCSPKGVRRVLSCSISLNDTVRSLSAAVIAKLLEDSHLWAKIVTHVFFIIATAHDNTPNHVATMIVVRGLECLAKLVRTGCDMYGIITPKCAPLNSYMPQRPQPHATMFVVAGPRVPCEARALDATFAIP